MKVKSNKPLWIMQNPDGGMYIETVELTRDKCWGKFSDHIEHWKKQGYKPVKVQIVEVQPEKKIEH